MTKTARPRDDSTLIGWREWVGLPAWEIGAIKAKVDTGARTSAMHAFDLESFERDDEPWVRFEIHPWQRSNADQVVVEAPRIGRRTVTSSSGARTDRPVVMAHLQIAGRTFDAELTLTRRDEMGFRMLIGREALRRRFLIDPARSYVGGRPPRRSPPPESGAGMTAAGKRRGSFAIGDLELAAGRAGTGELPVAMLVTGNRISIPVRVVHGRHDGPTVWLSAAVHGDEIGGVEIIRRTLASLDARTLHGTVIAVPIVNVHGFLSGDRYLPDRRDLNRSFPGSPNGSLAGRIANLFMGEIVQRCDVGIDLHTGSDHRTNLPQIRADLDDPLTRDLAIAFGAPLMLHAKLRDGSMRAAATAAGATMLLFEGGEAWRFDEHALAVGARGVARVLHRLGMNNGVELEEVDPPVESRSSSWVRARRSGIALLHVTLGDTVSKGAAVATIHDSVGKQLSVTRAHRTGVVIGHTQHPLVNQGDAIVHIAETHDAPDPSGISSSPDSKDIS